MKKFLIEIFTFSLILAFILFLIKKTVPFYWGNELITQKVNYLLAEEDKYDTFFIGSSKTYRHIIPKSFDQITGTNSYNLGCSAMFALETHYILENFIDLYPNNNFDCYLLKLTPNKIANKNLHTVRSKYYMDFKRLKMGIRYFLKEKKYHQVYNHLLSYLENLLCIGEIIPILKYHFGSKKKLKYKIKAQKGYYSLEQEMKSENLKGLKKRNREFLNSKVEKKLAREITIKKISKEMLNFSVPSEKNISFYDISGNPTHLQKKELQFDKGHFNSKGAELYTKAIGRVKKQMK